MDRLDAVVVGAGPNGLAAAVTLARAGRRVQVIEASDTVGGGTRSAELTLPGIVHDVCSAIHPLGVASPLFRALPLDQYGLEWVHPKVPVAHPLDDGTAAVLARSVDDTARDLGPDAAAYRSLMAPLVKGADAIISGLLGPLRPPSRPVPLARFGLGAVRSVKGLASGSFAGVPAKALLAGIGGHAILPLERPTTAAFALFTALLGHAVGWPAARGGSQAIADALAAYLRDLGGEITTGWRVGSLDELPPARAVLLDLTPRQLIGIAGDRLPSGYRWQLERFRHGPGVFKLDWALDGPVPWAAPDCAAAGTLHLGGTLGEIAAAERAVAQGRHPERPFVLVAQQSRFDHSRAPQGRQALWAYCHVPNGSDVDMTEAIEAQIERFAPGFRDRILARSAMGPAALEAHNANYIGGDIVGGAQTPRQMLFRPAARTNPYRTPIDGVYLCSSSTPPGGGVHGMCGYRAARSVLKRLGKER
ncbi:MAG TPA: NAD(P)/FAD-dependent oxidoreductase [Egibacteraceae bacterium]|nr:NAD(P)/FAD-dependent oxidoreductase [Egibacteraceae bacterium]